MNALDEYIDLIVEPTFEDFRKNPGSTQHGFLACVAAFHSVDRAAQIMSKKPATVRQKWCSKSFEFTAIDMIAHHFKHTSSSLNRPNPHHEGIPLSFALGLGGKPDQLETRNLVFLVRDVLASLRQQATTLPVAEAPRVGDGLGRLARGPLGDHPAAISARSAPARPRKPSVDAKPRDHEECSDPKIGIGREK